MRGGKSLGLGRKTTRSSGALHSSPPALILDEPSPVLSPIHNESTISEPPPNVNGFTQNDSTLPEELSTPLSPINNHSTEINHEHVPNQPISSTTTNTRPYIEVYGNTFDPLNLAYDMLKHIIHSHYDEAYTCFSMVSDDTKELWWKEFQKDILEREPTPKETFEKCYKKKDGTWSGKAQEAVKTFDKLVDEATRSAETQEGGPSNIDITDLWINAVGGAKNGGIFGLGSEARGILQMAR